jgi:hypothetical protein
VTGDWRDFRPTIWSVMLAVAVALLVNPWFISLFFVGAAIGLTGRTLRLRRDAARRAAADDSRRQPPTGGRRRP